MFNFKNITKEDLKRIESYKKIREYDEVKTNSSNIESFLKDLNPKIYLKKIDKKSVTRSNQLLGKTNQFKFNNKIFSEKELLKIKERTIVMSFEDKFQNYGIIGVLIYELDKKNKSLLINNWVMSCRVFSRRIEDFIIEFLIKKVTILNYDSISFNFKITKKNIYLQNFLKQLNFKLFKQKTKYSLKIIKLNKPKTSYIKYNTNL